ncbi:dihydrodipicolinate reductase [Novosphingobium bradum]|uniref:Dihydrodipicolinate reductase n=1 Tax=Novosphingobium bradum TaxID=1737444 RepID=A0ABV7IJH6_9SPHN
MVYRVIHCGTGNVGRHALRGILRNPELELVGHYVSTPDKAGRDSGELIGLAPAGVITTNDWAELHDLKADCLIYFGNAIGREDEAVMDLVPFLERGTNVVTFSGFSLAHPATTPPHQRKLIEDACATGQSSCFFTGIDPGWATTDLAIAALAAADQIECLRVAELGYFGEYSAEYVMREYFGFGQPLDFEPLFVKGGFIEVQWGPTLHQLAEVLDTEIEETRIIYERQALDYDIECGFGTVKAGTAAFVHFEYQALSKGRPFVVVEHVDCVSRDWSKLKWKRPHGEARLAYRIDIEGNPDFSVELSYGQDGSLLAAMPVLNAVPALCAARPGLLGPLDLPRYWSKRVVR